MKNNTFEEIAKIISKADKILLYPHVNMDGDTLGSSVALCKALRKAGKTCYVLIEDKIPANLAFLDRDYCTSDQNIVKKADLSVCIDCGDASRFVQRKDKFEAAKKSVCIDHHRTTVPYCDYNYIDSTATGNGGIDLSTPRSDGRGNRQGDGRSPLCCNYNGHRKFQILQYDEAES